MHIQDLQNLAYKRLYKPKIHGDITGKGLITCRSSL